MQHVVGTKICGHYETKLGKLEDENCCCNVCPCNVMTVKEVLRISEISFEARYLPFTYECRTAYKPANGLPQARRLHSLNRPLSLS